MRRITVSLVTLALVIMGAVMSAVPAGAATPHEWASYGSAVSALYTQDQSTASYFFNQAGSFVTTGSACNTGGTTCDNALGTSPVPDGLAATPVARFASYALFSSDLSKISTSVFHYVMYDNESWSFTPTAEQQDPTTYMADFASLAHAHGFKMVFEPARDLGMVDTVCVKQSGWSLDQWYVNCDIAQAAGQDSNSGDQLWVQNQADTTNLTNYDYLFSNAISQALGAQSGEVVLGELSTSYGTTTQAYNAGKSILDESPNPAAGIYFTSGNASWWDTVLISFQNGGY